MEARHLDGDHTNNQLLNLKWDEKGAGHREWNRVRRRRRTQMSKEEFKNDGDGPGREPTEQEKKLTANRKPGSWAKETANTRARWKARAKRKARKSKGDTNHGSPYSNPQANVS